MKILYLITKSNFGGAQRYVYDLATATAKRGEDVAVGFGGNGILFEKLNDAGIRTISIPELERDINLAQDIKIFFRLFRIIKEESPDIIHINSSKMGALGALGARLWNVRNIIHSLVYKKTPCARVVFTGHGWAFNEERGDGERMIIAFIHWLTITLSHHTIAVSRQTRAQAMKLPFVWHKFSVIHNGIGAFKLLTHEKAITEILGIRAEKLLKNKPLIIGTIAELHKNKGLSYAIEGMALAIKQTATPLFFIIIGEGEEHKKLEQLVSDLKLENTVFFAGYKENAAQYLAAFDIFILPSITEAFPYVILEAGKAGLPVVATAVGGIPEVIDDMESGILIQSKNSGEIARALCYLADNLQRRTEIGHALSTRIANRFNLDTMVSDTIALYTKMNVGQA